MSQADYKKETDSEKKKEDWMNAKWRPMMGWMYMCICMFDFMVAPILWSMVQAYFHGGINTQWQPLTLQGAGLFHLAMGAVIGISAYGRTQEKLNGAEGGGLGSFGPGAGTTYVPPGGTPGGFNNTTPNRFGAPTTGFGSPATNNFSSPTPSFSGAPNGFSPAPSFGGMSSSTPTPTPVNITVTDVNTTSSPVAVNARGHKIVPQSSQPEL